MSKTKALFALLCLIAGPAFAQSLPIWTYSTQAGNPVATYQGNVTVLGAINPTGGIATGGPITLNGGLTTSTITASSTIMAPNFVSTNSFNGVVGILSEFVGTGTATLATGAAAGTSPSIACAASRVCDSLSGTVTLTTGTTPPTGGTLATITLPFSRTSAPNCVVKVKGVSGASYTDTETATVITLTDIVALTASTAYQLTYLCGGGG